MKVDRAKSAAGSDILILVLRVFLGVLFIYASISKVLNPAEFAQSVYYYRMLPVSLVNAFGVFLPWAELFAGICLILGTWTRGAAAIVGGLLLVFCIAISAAMLRGIDLRCGCFEAGGGEHVGLELLLRDVATLVAALLVYLRHSHILSLEALATARSVR